MFSQARRPAARLVKYAAAWRPASRACTCGAGRIAARPATALPAAAMVAAKPAAFQAVRHMGNSSGLGRNFGADSDNIHGSNAETLVNQQGVIEVEGAVAMCDGGGGSLGHPVEYIALDTRLNTVQVCKYCGLQFKMAEGFHAHH